MRCPRKLLLSGLAEPNGLPLPPPNYIICFPYTIYNTSFHNNTVKIQHLCAPQCCRHLPHLSSGLKRSTYIPHTPPTTPCLFCALPTKVPELNGTFQASKELPWTILDAYGYATSRPVCNGEGIPTLSYPWLPSALLCHSSSDKLHTNTLLHSP